MARRRSRRRPRDGLGRAPRRRLLPARPGGAGAAPRRVAGPGPRPAARLRLGVRGARGGDREPASPRRPAGDGGALPAPIEHLRSEAFLMPSSGRAACPESGSPGSPKRRAAAWRDALAVVFPGAWGASAPRVLVAANAAPIRLYLLAATFGLSSRTGEFERVRWPWPSPSSSCAGRGRRDAAAARLAAPPLAVLLVTAAGSAVLQGLAAVSLGYGRRLARAAAASRGGGVVLVLANPWALQILALLGCSTTGSTSAAGPSPPERRGRTRPGRQA